MHYFATLVVGGLYIYKDKKFLAGEELPVSKEEAEYFTTIKDRRLIEQGDFHQLINVPVFRIREEDLTVTEKVLEEIKTAPNSLKPSK